MFQNSSSHLKPFQAQRVADLYAYESILRELGIVCPLPKVISQLSKQQKQILTFALQNKRMSIKTTSNRRNAEILC